MELPIDFLSLGRGGLSVVIYVKPNESVHFSPIFLELSCKI